MLNYRLIFAPRWRVQLLTGVLFGTFMALFQLIQGNAGPIEATLLGAVSGLFFGLLFGWWMHKQTQPLREQLSPTLPSRRVRKAVLRGPLPDDPQERRTTGVLINYNLDQVLKVRRLNLVMFSMMTVVGAVLAFSEPWMGLVAAGGLFNLLYTPWVLKRLRQQQALLRT